MKRLRFWLRNYFGFSKTESNGFIILIPLMFVIAVAPYIWRHYEQGENLPTENTRLDSLATDLEAKLAEEERKRQEQYKKKYKTKQREWDNSNFMTEDAGGEDFEEENSYEPEKKLAPLTQFDINKVDTATLRRVYGIGPVLSNRIVKYRDLLGGFVTKNQLSEVYGLKDEALHNLDSLSFIATDFEPKKLPVNETRNYILDDHPYISKTVGKLIDSYRFQHGKIEDVTVLYKIHRLDSATVQKISPYLSF